MCLHHVSDHLQLAWNLVSHYKYTTAHGMPNAIAAVASMAMLEVLYWPDSQHAIAMRQQAACLCKQLAAVSVAADTSACGNYK